MDKKCPHCGEKLVTNVKYCFSCEERISRKRKNLFSDFSLILGCHAIGFFWWITALLLSSYVEYNINIIGYVFLNVFLVITLIGVIFGVISIKQGRKNRSIFGILLNLAVLVFFSWYLWWSTLDLFF